MYQEAPRKLKHHLMAQMLIQIKWSESSAKEGEVEDADFEVVEEENKI